MANNFNAEQARKNAKDVKIDQAILLEKILTGTEEISKEGKRRAVFQFPIDEPYRVCRRPFYLS